MKICAVVILTLFSYAGVAEILITPGSSITVNANEPTVVACSESASKNLCECTISAPHIGGYFTYYLLKEGNRLFESGYYSSKDDALKDCNDFKVTQTNCYE